MNLPLATTLIERPIEAKRLNTFVAKMVGQTVDTVYLDRLKADFKAYLQPLQKGETEIASSTIIAYDYSHIIPFDRNRSGIQLYDFARNYDDRYSHLRTAENRLIIEACDDFAQLAKWHLPFESLGPGTQDAVITKDYQIVRSLASTKANFLEIEQHTGNMAANTLRMQMQGNGERIAAKSFCMDFTKPWPAELQHGKPRFAVMLGGTMGQLDLHEFFSHFNEMTKGNALLFFVLNGNRREPTTAYSGQDFKEFKSSIWYLLRTAANDTTFNAKALTYVPDFDGEAVRHRYIVTEDTRIAIDGEQFPLKRGTVAVTGYSARPTPEQVRERSKGTGLTVAKVYPEHATHTNGYVMRGHNFDYNFS